MSYQFPALVLTINGTVFRFAQMPRGPLKTWGLLVGELGEGRLYAVDADGRVWIQDYFGDFLKVTDDERVISEVLEAEIDESDEAH